MRSLIWKAILQGVSGLVFFALLIFLSAGTLNYWQGWMFLGVFTALTVGFTIYLLRKDVPLLERRMNAGPWKEEDSTQKVIVSLIILSFFAYLVLPSLDHRFGFSPVPAWASIVGEVLIILSFAFIYWVTSTNSFAAANIAVAPDQKVISTGPYAYVRHPMYAGTIWLFIGIPLALGSWWTIALIVPVLAVLAWRLLDEERILARDLPGYREYMQKVRYRLVPRVW